MSVSPRRRHTRREPGGTPGYIALCSATRSSRRASTFTRRSSISRTRSGAGLLRAVAFGRALGDAARKARSARNDHIATELAPAALVVARRRQPRVRRQFDLLVIVAVAGLR